MTKAHPAAANTLKRDLFTLFNDAGSSKEPMIKDPDVADARSHPAGAAMIRRCSGADFPAIEAVINQAAQAYRGVIPADCWHEPYMTGSALGAEIESGVNFWGWDESGALIGVMGLQHVRDVTLIRHAYVQTAHQGQGIGGALLAFLVDRASGPLLVGTWAAAVWAIRFYERHGFRLVSPAEKDRLLSTYWGISLRQKETSVVLASTRHSVPAEI